MDVLGEPSAFKAAQHIQPNKVASDKNQTWQFLNICRNSNVSNEIKMAIKRANTIGFSSVSFKTRTNLTNVSDKNQHGKDLQFD